MAFATEGFATMAQDYISLNVASNFYNKLPFLSILGAFSLTRNKKNALNIGRPGGEVLTGKVMSPGETLQLKDFNAYKPRIQKFTTSNSKWMGKYDTNPVVSNPTTNAHSQATQATAAFYRARLKTPILVWHTDKDRALQGETKKGQGIAMGRIIEDATEIAYQEHVTELNAKIWNGNPSDQTADPWDQPLGILQALSATNTYGNVDRSVAGNSVWRAQVDSTLTAMDVRKVVDDANITKQLRTKGDGCDLLITTPTIYLAFKAQIEAAAHGQQQAANEVLKMGQFGFTQEVLRKDNTFIMYDETCPANNVLALTMRTWRMAIAPGKNLTVSPFTDISKATEGAKEADQAFIETDLIFSCDNPFLNIRYTGIGT